VASFSVVKRSRMKPVKAESAVCKHHLNEL
jgi:hypothetical protein